MALLLALLLWAPPASAAKPYDAEVERLAARARELPDWYARCGALRDLEKFLKSDTSDDELAVRLKSIAEDVGRREANIDVRHCAGDLSRGIDDWRNWSSPAARARRARRERIDRLKSELFSLGFPLAMIAVLLFGGLAVVASQIGAAYLIVHADRLLDKGLRGTAALFRRHPSLLALPAFSAAVVSALLGWSYWRVLNDPRIMAPGSGAVLHPRVLEVVYQPASLLAVAAAFFLAMLANVAYLSAQVRAARGEDAGLLVGLRDALAAAWEVALLSTAVCAALAGLDWAVRKIGRFLTFPEALMVRFGAAAVESAAMLVLNTAFCAIIFEREGPVEAVKRAVAVIKPQWRSGLRAAAATAILRTDVIATPVFCCGLCTYPLWMLVGMRESAAHWLLSGGLEFIALACLGLGGVFASFIMALVWLLDASFSAALYLHAAGEKPLPDSLLRVIASGRPEPAAR